MAEHLGLVNLPLLGFDVERLDPDEKQKMHGRAAIAQFDSNGYTVRKSGKRVEGRKARQSEALFNAVVMSLRPEVIGLCPRKWLPTHRAWGPEALACALADSAAQSSHMVSSQLKGYLRSLVKAEALLGRLSGTSRDRASNQLRSAAAIMNEASSIWKEGTSHWRRVKRAGDDREADRRSKQRLLAEVRALTTEALFEVFEGAIARTGARVAWPVSVERHIATPAELNEMVYVSRAGGPRFRQLAARSLYANRDDRAITALGQLLFDAEAPVSDAAVQSLSGAQVDSGRKMLERALESAPDARIGSRTSVRPLILESLADRPTEEFRTTLLQSLGELERPDAEAIRAVAAWLLYHRFPDNSFAQFASAFESAPTPERRLAGRYLRMIQDSS